MNLQTPISEPSCPCCRALDPISCCNEGGDKHDEFSHQCLSCGCLWDQSKCVPASAPATEPAAAGEAGPAVYIKRHSDGLYSMTVRTTDQMRALDALPDGSPLYLRPPAAQPLPAGGMDDEAERRLFDAQGFDKYAMPTTVYAQWQAWLARSRLSRGEGRDAVADARDADRYRELNSPEIVDFLKAVEREALHQRDIWETEHDAGKTATDWLWLIAYLSTKATQAERYGDPEKYLHHIVTTAAACLNWHANAMGAHKGMRPSADPLGDASLASDAAQGK